MLDVNRPLPFGTSAMMDIVSIVCLHWARAMRGQTSPTIVRDSLEAWSQAAFAFLANSDISQQERIDARVLAVELFGRMVLAHEENAHV